MKLIMFLGLMAMAMAGDVDLNALLVESNNNFTARMFTEVVNLNADKSVVLSAFSVLSPLAQLGIASVEGSHDEILRAIGFPNDNVTTQVFEAVNARLRAMKGVELKMANRIYIAEDAELNTNFGQVSRNVFNSDVKNVDFAKNEKTAGEVNAWIKKQQTNKALALTSGRELVSLFKEVNTNFGQVSRNVASILGIIPADSDSVRNYPQVEEQTNNKIKDLVDPKSLGATTRALLVNAIYFKGSWKYQFDKPATKDADFHVTKDKTVQVPIMHKTATYRYGESSELNAKLLALPYEGEETYMLIVLPNEVDGLNEVNKKLLNPATLIRAMDEMYSTEVDVSIPKFKIETTTNLKDVLKKMEIKKLFEPGQARLDNLLAKEANLCISDAIQKAFIEVNEEGAEAGAANAFFATRSARVSKRKRFTVTHPFYYQLNSKNLSLFNGIYSP